MQYVELDTGQNEITTITQKKRKKPMTIVIIERDTLI